LRKALIPVFIIVFLLSLIPLSAQSIVYNSYYCTLYERTGGILLECSEEILLTQDGLTIQFASYNDSYNYFRVIRGINPTTGNSVILVDAYNYEGEAITVIDLPVNRIYAGVYVTGWNVNIIYYNPNLDLIYYYTTTVTNRWEFKTGNTKILYFSIKPIYMSLTPSETIKIPPWYDIGGWLRFLGYLVTTIGQAGGIALAILTYTIEFIKILPYMLLIIPLHIALSFLHSPVTGVKTINFYISLGKKIIDILLKIIHAIVDIIGHAIPF
jgi:hypothetical protein